MNKLLKPVRSSSRLISNLLRGCANKNKLTFFVPPFQYSKFSIFNSSNKKFNTWKTVNQQHASSLMRRFHTNHVAREPVITIAASKLRTSYTSNLFVLCLMVSSFLLVFWYWDKERDGVFFQIINSEFLDEKIWKETLENGQSQPFVKLNGKILLKNSKNSISSFNKKPLEISPIGSDEILLIHYFLTCYNRSPGRNFDYSTHNFYIIRNNPMVMKFIDPTNPSREIIVDFYMHTNLIGTRDG